MERLTNEQLAEIRKRAEAATPGPWYCGTEYEQSNRGNYVASQQTGVIVTAEQDGTDCVLETSDAEFIAHAREDVPKLLAEIERLRELAHEILEEYDSAERRVIDEVVGVSRTFSLMYHDFHIKLYRKEVNGVDDDGV